MPRLAPSGLFTLACAISACGASPPPPAPPVPSAALPAVEPSTTPRASSVVLMGRNAFKSAAWTSSNDVVAISRQALFRMRPGAPATMTRLPALTTSFSSAKRADVVAVGLVGGTVFVRASGATRLVAVDTKTPHPELSPDGTRFVVPLDADDSAIYDATTGAPLGRVEGRGAAFDDSGEFVATPAGVYRVKDGSLIAKLDAATMGGAAFVGSRAVAFDDDSIVVVDAPKGAVVRLPAHCSMPSQRVDSVDEVAKRAVRDCGDKMFVAGIEKLTRAEIKLPKAGSSMEEMRGIYFTYGPAIVVQTGMRGDAGDTIHLVDPERRTASKIALAERPPLRETNGTEAVFREGQIACKPRGSSATPTTAWCQARVSPDGRALLAFEAGAFAVLDAANGAEQMRWGAFSPRDVARRPEYKLTDVRARAGGLDVVAVGEAAQEMTTTATLRIGPPATALPPTRAKLPRNCRGGKRTTHRKVGERDLFVDAFGSSRGCICQGDQCTPLQVPARTRFMDWSTDLVLGTRIDDTGAWRARVAAHDGSNETLSSPLGRCAGMAFADGARTVFAVCRNGDDALPELFELGVPGLDLRKQHRILDLEPHDLAIVAGQTSVILAIRNQWTDARVLRRTDAQETASIHVRDDFAIVRFEDGNVELIGNVPGEAAGCLDGDKLEPLAKCRARIEVKDRFRFE